MLLYRVSAYSRSRPIMRTRSSGGAVESSGVGCAEADASMKTLHQKKWRADDVKSHREFPRALANCDASSPCLSIQLWALSEVQKREVVREMMSKVTGGVSRLALTVIARHRASAYSWGRFRRCRGEELCLKLCRKAPRSFRACFNCDASLLCLSIQLWAAPEMQSKGC